LIVKKFHLPLPERTFAELRTDADRAYAPANPIARKAGVGLRAGRKHFDTRLLPRTPPRRLERNSTSILC